MKYKLTDEEGIFKSHFHYFTWIAWGEW